MIIPANKKRIPFALIISLLIVFVLVMLIYPALRDFNQLDADGIINLAIYLLLFCLVFPIIIINGSSYIKLQLSKNSALVINEDGFEDTLGFFSVGYISWLEVVDIEVLTFYKMTFLIIKVLNPDRLIDKKNRIQQKAMKGWLKKYGGPILIYQKQVNYNLESLKEIMLKHVK